MSSSGPAGATASLRCAPRAAWRRPSSSNGSEVGRTLSIGESAGLRREISLKLTVIARQLRKRFDQNLEGIDVTRSQWTMIAVVARRPGVTQREIAEVLDMSEAAAGRLIDRLCADGLLERRAKEDDRRAYRIFLTEQTKPILERVSGIAAVLEENSFRGIAEDDLAKLAALLDAVYRNINP